MPQTGQYSAADLQPTPPPAQTGQYSAADIGTPQDFRGSATAKIQAYETARKNTPWYKFGPELPEFTPDESKTLTRSEQFMYGGNPGASEGRGLREGLATYGERSVGQAVQGVQEISQGNIAKGSHQAISGLMNAATPAAPFVVAGAPITAARALAGGTVGSTLAGIGSKAAGATPDQQELAGDIGNLLGGFSAASGLPRALLETPIKQLIAKSGAGDTLIDLLQNGWRKTAVDAIRGWLKDANVTPASFPKTHSVIESEIGPLEAAAPKTPASAPPTAPTPIAMPPRGTAPASMAEYYGKTKSNLAGNQRQLAGPTASTAPNPTTPKEQIPKLIPKANMSPEDLKLQDDNMAAILQATIDQLRSIH